MGTIQANNKYTYKHQKKTFVLGKKRDLDMKGFQMMKHVAWFTHSHNATLEPVFSFTAVNVNTSVQSVRRRPLIPAGRSPIHVPLMSTVSPKIQHNHQRGLVLIMAATLSSPASAASVSPENNTPSF